MIGDMHPTFDLDRFVDAQRADGTYDRALGELRAGRKRSHWMWFVFPQLAGLGRSATAQHFAIVSLDEARAYLAHPVLGPRLVECAAVVTALPGPPQTIFGGIDAMKLRSSMTLFDRAGPQQPQFAAVLAAHFAGRADESTERLLTTR